MSTPPHLEQVAPIEVVLRFELGDSHTVTVPALESLAELLGSQPGCERCWVGRSTDEPSRWMVGSRWVSVGAYRKALSSYDVKANATQILGTAKDETSVFEVLVEHRGGKLVKRESDRNEPQGNIRQVR